MAAADNPYYIKPVNAMEALMSGYEGYDRSQKAGQQRQMQEGRQAAMTALQSGGDLKGPLAQLIGIGDTKGAEAIATYAHQQATTQQASAALAESSRHNRVNEGQAGATLAETKRQHDVAAMQPVKLGTGLAGDIYGVKDQTQPSGYRIIDINQIRQQGQPATPTSPALEQRTEGESIPATARPTQAGGSATNDSVLDDIMKEYGPVDGPKVISTIKKMTSYEVDPRTFSTRNNNREKYIGLASQYDPTYDQTQFPASQRALNNFTGGVEGRTTRSFNVAISHLDTLQKLYDAIDNGNVQVFNSVKNRFKEQFGSELPTNLDAARQVIGSEVVKAIVGAQSAAGERGESKESISAKLSPKQAAGVIGTYKELFGGQVGGLEQSYKAGTRKNDYRTRFLSSEAQDLMKQLDDRKATDHAAKEGKAGQSSTGTKWRLLD